MVNTLKSGHYDAVNACEYVAPVGKLFTAGSDGSVLVWESWQGDVGNSSTEAGAGCGHQGAHNLQGGLDDVDTWSNESGGNLNDLF